MSRGLNKAQIIGNLTKDPELKYTPSGTAVVVFSVATNRKWVDSQGQQKEDATFHRIVAWSKLAEICSKYLKKGSKVFIDGRIDNRTWEDKNNQKHYISEIVASEMIMLDNKLNDSSGEAEATNNSAEDTAPPEPAPEPEQKRIDDPEQEIDVDDIPF